MTKRSVIRLLLSVALIIYIGVAMYFAVRAEAAGHYSALRIGVEQNSETPFLTPDDINASLGGLQQRISAMSRDSVNTLAIEQRLMALDNIETANCVVLNDGSMRLDVTPLVPVARVFDANGASYYVNHAGKRMMASPHFRCDVPVITGHFGRKMQPCHLMPLLDHLNANPQRAQLISQISISPNGDIMLVPMVSGHVINFGDTSDIDNKFARLETFYHKVLPVKGWAHYDTIAVKWRGQIVAKKRVSKPKNNFIPVDEHLDIDDDGTMSTPQENP